MKKIKMEEKDLYKSRDFYTSALLKTLGYDLLRLERSRGKFVTFVFDDPEGKAKETINQYWNREIVCNARDLIETINELKTRIHNRT